MDFKGGLMVFLVFKNVAGVWGLKFDIFECRFENRKSTDFGQKWSMENARIYFLRLKKRLDLL